MSDDRITQVAVEDAVPFNLQVGIWGYALTGQAWEFSALMAERGGDGTLMARYGVLPWDKTATELEQIVYYDGMERQPVWKFAIAGSWLGRVA